MTNPDYFFWNIEKNIFAKDASLKEEVEILFRRSIAIKIPNNENNIYQIEYILQAASNVFSRFEIVKATKPKHKGGSLAS